MAFNRGVARAWNPCPAVVLAVRNENVRRVELAWGAAIAAEWAHFVGLGVFAYKRGVPRQSGSLGFVRLLPAAIVAPSRLRSLIGSAASAFSLAVCSAWWQRFGRLRGSRVRGLGGLVSPSPRRRALVDVDPADVAGAAAVTRAYAGGADRVKRRDVDDRERGTLVGPLLAGVLVALAPTSESSSLARAARCASAPCFSPRVKAEGQILETCRDRAGAYRELRVVFDAIAQLPGPRRVLGLMVAQTFVRGCLNVLIVVAAFRSSTQARRSRLPDGRDRRRRAVGASER